MSLCFKNFDVLQPLLDKTYHPKMVEVLEWYYDQFHDALFTSTVRIGDSGVHGTSPCRGIDLRTRHLPRQEIDYRVFLTNETWIYDPLRPRYDVCIHHNAHIHFQVHDNTERRVEVV